MFENIIVAVGLTENSLPPLKKSLQLRGNGSRLFVLYVVPEEGEEAHSSPSFVEAEDAESSVFENYALP